jgi:hypothetical protein
MRIVGKDKNRRLVPSPYSRAIGAKILEWHLAGWSREAIYSHLLRNGIKTWDGREWGEKMIRSAIKGEMELQQKELAALQSGDKTGDKTA